MQTQNPSLARKNSAHVCIMHVFQRGKRAGQRHYFKFQVFESVVPRDFIWFQMLTGLSTVVLFSKKSQLLQT
jgi:hypothetical protein